MAQPRSMSRSVINYSWEEFEKDSHLIKSRIKNPPDYVAGVKRGGLTPATKLSHLLEKPLLVISIEEDRASIHGEVPENSRILVVDDICDSGKTFKQIEKLLEPKNLRLEFCSLVHNTAQDFKTDHYAKTIDRSQEKRWIVFPWESQRHSPSTYSTTTPSSTSRETSTTWTTGTAP